MDVSVIIPYYNTGAYLPEALASLKGLKDHPVYTSEIIIINDGSTDPASVALLDEIKNDGYIIINIEHKGLSAARNAGLAACTGDYILLLDSDNKLRDIFINLSIPLLKIGGADIIYGKAHFFGASKKPTFKQDVFHLPTMVARNYIDACCIIKRKVWETLGDFDENLNVLEDWEYWIRAGKAGFKFQFVDKYFYDYRVHAKSLTSGITDKSYYEARKYIYTKHPETVIDSFFYVSEQFHAYQQDKKKPLRSFFKFFYLKYLKS
jgi:glycosyltransferase involved in cell wall biosynthesis